VAAFAVTAAAAVAIAAFAATTNPPTLKVISAGSGTTVAPSAGGSPTTFAVPTSTATGDPGAAPVPAVAGSTALTTPVSPRPAPATVAPTTVTPTTVTLGSVTTTVTESDSGRSYVLRRGDRLVVNLNGSPIYTWTAPTSSNSLVLPRTTASPGATASSVFLAAVDGQSSVSAVDNPNCYPGCLPPSRLFKVSVTVTG
jgi:hypothetical protein